MVICRTLVVGLMIPVAFASAQERVGSIRGVVVDADLGGPLAEVVVSALEVGASARSDDTGSFVLAELAPGAHTLVFAKEGFVRQVRADVVVAPGRVTELSVSLAADVAELDEFVVEGLADVGARSEAALLQLRFESRSLIDAISSDLMGRAAASDAASALRLVSGASLQDGRTAVIRGLPDRYVSTQMNGVRLPSADEDKRAVELDQFPAAILDSLEVSKTFTPDQQGDASGGAVDVRLVGVPQQPLFFEFGAQTGYHSQATGRSRFLSYDGGGVRSWGDYDGSRDIQLENLGASWDGAVGVSPQEAPVDYKWNGALGGRHELAKDFAIGGFAGLTYERDSSFHDDGIDDSYWVESPGAGMTPKTSQGSPQDGTFKTSLFDVTQAQQSVQWSGLLTFGVETRDHSVGMVVLRTRTVEDTVTLAEDTRGKQWFFPGHDPDDPTTAGHDEPDGAPYLRLETLEYTERNAGTLQWHGRHSFPLDRDAPLRAVELDWTVSRSAADLYQPDKRLFGSQFLPGRVVGPIRIPPSHRAFKPAANFTLGNVQRIYKEIEEDSEQYAGNLNLPFRSWTDDDVVLKVGVFRDDVERRFAQETFSNFNDNGSFDGPFDQLWSGSFRFEDHPITESRFDVDYRGDQRIEAWYAMVDVPLTDFLRVIGGARFESTSIGIVNAPEAGATWFPPGSLAPTELRPGDADVAFRRYDKLPAVALVIEPLAAVTLRLSYGRTVARQTFKELSPILQQEYLGGPIFIGNPELRMSEIDNWDARVDWRPYHGGLLSASWFEKDIDEPIEYVQRVASFDFTTAANYPSGELSGIELETRHELGWLWDVLEGFSIGANATFLDASVRLPDDEARGFDLPSIRAPMSSRDMTGAPEYLNNWFLTWDVAATGTRLGVFYTVQGDTLVAGAGQADGNFVPSVYAKTFDTLNVTLAQDLGEHVTLRIQGKNLTDPEIETVYRSEYIGSDVTRGSFTRGVEYTLSISGEYRF